MLNGYLIDLQHTMNLGDAREESYYLHLEQLIRVFAKESRIKSIDITILPKKTEAGNPDFRIWDGQNHITGYIEAKDPSVKNLDRVENSEQLKRYRSTFPNVILTNFYEFRLYRNGELIRKVSVGRPILAKKLQSAPPVENALDFEELLHTFFSFTAPVVRNSRTLAHELAKRTRFLKDEVIAIELAEGESKGQNAILGFYEAFKTYLLSTVTEKQFADLYSQTITYGLFAARTRAKNGFNRKLAFDYIPNTIGILRDVFRFISLGDPPKSLEVIIDDISEILNVADVKQILHDYYHEGKGDDPIIHFYETFLTEYDPSIREKRGVYYTPEPVVDYIVKAVHQILQSHFDIPDGLAGEGVTLLDPAAGTLTFPAEALKVAVNAHTEKYGPGGKSKLIREQILPNFFAFELMMAPYAIGHLKMSFMLEELGYTLKDDERFNLYLTNTLEMEDLQQIRIPGLSSLSEESHKAGQVKKQQQILVIIGNPPYSGISMNINEWTEKLLKQNLDGAQSYYEVDGKPLGEKNPKWLQDDYVKFLRFAQWKIHRAGFGVVGMITNHSYLDNPTFRGMRQSLMRTFSEIYIIDLHGNSLKKEIAPDGGKDQNVFDIRQGTAIALFIKQKNNKGCKVHHLDLFGMREAKYNWLSSNSFNEDKYKHIKPEKPWYFFIPRNTANINQFLKWKAINEIFPVNVTGIVTARDGFVIDFDRKSLRNRMVQFRNLTLPDEVIQEAYNLKDTREWKFSEARKLLAKDKNWENYFQKILYRPFDIREIYYTDKMVDWGRPEVMRHMTGRLNNIGISVSKRVEGNMPWEHALVSDKMITHHSVSLKEVNILFPLYLINTKPPKKRRMQTMMVFEPEPLYASMTPNISTDFHSKLNDTFDRYVSPEEILNYIYAMFYSNIYRKKYEELLKIDFPRVPVTANADTFGKVAELGKKLVDLHLMKESAFGQIISKYQVEQGNDMVEKVDYDEIEHRIYINPINYFDNVTPDVWEYRIGGYQVLKKYLSDRAKARRDIGDHRYFSRVITALHHTLRLQTEIDTIYPEIENQLTDFENE